MTVAKRLLATTERIWRETERAFGYPFLSVELVGQAAPPARLTSRTIQISAPFVDAMETIGVAPEVTISLLTAREANAWTRIPADFAEYVGLYASLRAVVYSETVAARFLQSYFDIWNDLELYRHHGLAREITLAYRASVATCGLTAHDNFYKVLAATLSAKLDGRFGVRLDAVHSSLVEQLARLDYLAPSDRVDEIRAFGRIVSKLFFLRHGEGGALGLGVAGPRLGQSGAASKGAATRWPLGSDMARDLGGMVGLEHGIARFTGKLTETGISDLLLEALSRMGASGIAVAGYTNGRWWYYRELAHRSPIAIQRKLAKKSSPAVPVDLTCWTPEDETDRISPFASFGRLASPGITQRWRVSGEDSQYKTFVLPSLLILIDSSGSMPNPTTALSYPVLAGVTAACGYLSHGSSVGVYNFSDADLVLDFSRDEADVLKHVSAFKCGRTEVIKPEIVTRLLDQAIRDGCEVDIMLITDMQMTSDELQRVMTIARDHEEVHRLFLLVKTGDVSKIRAQFEGTRVKVYPVNSEADVAELGIGMVREAADA